MRLRYVLLIASLLFVGCSFKTDNRYKYRVDASNSFDSFKKYYLQGKTRLASVELKRALQSAKEGSDINSIAKIYLGECALHKAMLIDDNCSEYLQIKELVSDKDLENYYLFITGKFQKLDTSLLPKSYRDFANYLKRKNFDAATKALFEIKNSDSKIIAASIIKRRLSRDDIKKIIDISSAMGYKKVTTRWYNLLKTKSTDKQKRVIDKKLMLFKKHF